MKKFLLICGFLLVSICSAFAVDFNSVKTACRSFLTDKNASCVLFNISNEDLNANVFVKAQNVRGILFTESAGDCEILFSFGFNDSDDHVDFFDDVLVDLRKIELDQISSISYTNSVLTLNLTNLDFTNSDL